MVVWGPRQGVLSDCREILVPPGPPALDKLRDLEEITTSLGPVVFS